MHYTFIHGRSLDWKIFSYFTKKLAQAFRPDLKNKLFEFLRAPVKTHLVKNSRDFLRRYREINDDYCFFRKELICADACWISEAYGESAMYYFKENRNAYRSLRNVCYPLITSCIDKKTPKRKFLILSFLNKIQQAIQNLFITLNVMTPNEYMPGELVVICIPKTLVKDCDTNPVYRSLPLGRPCTESQNAELDLPFLEKLQQDEIPEDFVPQNGITNFFDKSVQYRLSASQLTPKNGVRIFGVNGLSNPHSASQNAFAYNL